MRPLECYRASADALAAVGPLAANIVSPLHWVNGDVTARNELTYQIARTVIGIQVMWTGITLPA